MTNRVDGSADVLLIATGGTIAAEAYDKTPEFVTVTTNERVVSAMKSLTELTLANARQKLRNGDITASDITEAFLLRIAVNDFCNKDSKDITSEDIGEIAKAIAGAPQKMVLITTGTDYMAPNARALKAELQAYYPDVLRTKNIIFTGAVKPLNHEGSDGQQNLSDALEVAMRNARPGVAIVMHGMVFDPEKTDKHFRPGTFEGVLSEVRVRS